MLCLLMHDKREVMGSLVSIRPGLQALAAPPV